MSCEVSGYAHPWGGAVSTVAAPTYQKCFPKGSIFAFKKYGVAAALSQDESRKAPPRLHPAQARDVPACAAGSTLCRCWSAALSIATRVLYGNRSICGALSTK